MKISIVDYGVGNIQSIKNALDRLGVRTVEVTGNISKLNKADGLILPGVGAFGACAARLKSNGFSDTLTELVVGKKKPILGICVGMQLMADSSREGGFHKGLGWIPGKIKRIDVQQNLPVPHVSWNDIHISTPNVLFGKVASRSHFYFDHSYHYLGEEKYVSATCEYGGSLNVAINLDNIFGVQFHPEKSAFSGLRIFRGYLNWVEQC